MRILLYQCGVYLLIQICGVACTITIIPMTASNSERNYNIVQMSSMELIKLESKPNYLDLEYLILELTISTSTMQYILANDATYPITCYQYNADPFVSVEFSSQELVYPCQKGYDFNQYSRANGFYSMIVPTPFGQYNLVMIGIYIQSTVSYNVKIRGRFSLLPYDLCPFDCNMGSSTQADCTDQTCTCPSDLIDYDCSQQAEEITTSKKSIQLQPNVISYAYYRPHKAISNINEASNIVIEMSIQSSDSSVNILVSLEGVSPKKIVPTEDFYRLNQAMDPGLNTMKLDPDIQFDSQLQPLYCVLGFLMNSGTVTNTLTIQIRSSDDSISTSFIIIFFLVGVVALFFIVWIVLTIIRIKYARRNRVVDITNQQNIIIQGQMPNRRRQQQSSKLTAQLIDQYMPALTFKEIFLKEKERGKSFVEACPVCLGEFEDTEICRQAICNHYFHKDCIEQWLKKQENCPFCRADLSTEALTGVKDPGDSVRHHQTDQTLQQQSSSQNRLRSQQQQQVLQASPNLLAPSQPPPPLRISSSPQRSNHSLAAAHSRQSILNREQLHILPAPSVNNYNNMTNPQGAVLLDLQEQPLVSQALLLQPQQPQLSDNNLGNANLESRPIMEQEAGEIILPSNPLRSTANLQQRNLNNSQQPFVEEIPQ